MRNREQFLLELKDIIRKPKLSIIKCREEEGENELEKDFKKKSERTQ